MNLVSVRIITENIDSLINFYEQVTGIQAIQYTPDFAEIKTSTTTHGYWEYKNITILWWGRRARAAKNQTAIIEFYR